MAAIIAGEYCDIVLISGSLEHWRRVWDKDRRQAMCPEGPWTHTDGERRMKS